MNLTKILQPYIDLNYRKFQTKICNTNYEILGIKIPILRKIAKDLIKKNNYEPFLNANSNYYEIILLQGLIIGNLNISFKEKIELISNYLPKIDNWAICDTFCSELKFIKKNYPEFLIFLNEIKIISKEYYLRFYIVILLNYYITDQYISYVLDEMLLIKSDKYYVNMAIAWCLSICLIKYYNQTLNFLKMHIKDFDPWIIKKTVSKANDSYQLTLKQKEEVKELILA